MDKVYLVEHSDYDVHIVHSAWSSGDKAEEEIRRMRRLRRHGRMEYPIRSYGLYVEEYDVG